MTIIWLGNGIAHELLYQAEQWTPLETGGVLLGWRSPGHVCVTNIIGPGPAAHHTGTSFRPDAVWQAEQIAQLYAASGRRLAYLGDWHTHPGATPVPSPRDVQTLDSIARHPSARCPQPIMIIIGQPHTAQWVVEAHAIAGNWSSGKKVVCNLPVKSDPKIESLI